MVSSKAVDRIKSHIECSGKPISVEALGREFFKAPTAPRSLLVELITPFLKKIPGAYLRSDGCVEWKVPHVSERNLDDVRYVVVDLETTGSSTKNCRVTEVAAYVIERGIIVDEFVSLVNPQIPIPQLITDITGITDSMVADAPRFSDLADKLLQFIGENVIVAHNVGFDFAFLNMEFYCWDHSESLKNPTLCTVDLSRSLVPGLDNYKLHTVADYFGIKIMNRHRAAGDAFATAKLFLNLLDLLGEAGICTVQSAQNLKKSSGKRVLQKIIN